MTDSVEKRFVARMRTLLVALPYNLKALFEAMSDEDLPSDARRLATGAVIYCVSPADPIPDYSGLVGFTDDVVAVRLVLRQLLDLGGEAIEDYPERFPEQFEGLDDDLKLFQEYLGDDMGWLERRMKPDKMNEVKYKGKTIADFIADEEAGQYLYEEGLEFTTEYEIDDEAAEKLATGKPVRDAFAKRRNFEEKESR